jgi:hypothetical protein
MRRERRGNGAAAGNNNNNGNEANELEPRNEGDPRVADYLPSLGQRPMSQLVQRGPLRGHPLALVRNTLGAMPGLYARGPGAARGRGPAAAAVPAVAVGAGGGGPAGAAAAAAAANAAVGGAAAPDRWDPRVPHFELDRPVVMMDVPMRITEFNELVSISLDGLVRPVVNLLYGGEVNGEAVRELVEITTDSIRPALENFVEQLSSRSIAGRIAIDTTRHRAYIDRLATTTRGAHRAEIIRQLQEEYNNTIQPLGPALQTDPSIGQRLWAVFTRGPAPAARAPDSLLFRPPAGGLPGPVAPPGIAGGPPVAAAGYIPSDRDIRRRERLVQARLRRTYESAARFIQNYRVPNQETVLQRCPNIMKSLYTNILTALVEYTRLLIDTIGYRLNREGVLNRAVSTAGAQSDMVQQSGAEQVEVTFQNLRDVRFLSRDQIDNLMDQLILITVNYMNLSPDFRNLLPLVSQVYGVSTIYVVVADGDEGRGTQGALLGAVFSEHLQDLVANITREAVRMSDRYVINGNAWFNTDGLVDKLGTLGTVVDRFTLGIGSRLSSAVARSTVGQLISKSTLAKLVSPIKRVEVVRRTEASADGRRTHTTTIGRQTHYQVAREAANILSDVASPVWVALDRLLELVDPAEFNQTIELANGSRRVVRGNLGVGARQVVEIGLDTARGIEGIMTRINGVLFRRLGALRASGHVQTFVTALAGLDDQSAEAVMNELRVQGQGGYQQMRATLLATQASPNRRELEAMKGTPLSRRVERAEREGERVTPMYVSVTGQRVANTHWDRYAIFRNFYSAFTKYSIADEGTGRYSDFSAYIHSPLVYPHLLRFSLDDLLMMYQPLMAMEKNEEWENRYGEIIRLIDAAIESRQRLGAAMEPQSNNENNENSYHPSENENNNDNGNNRNNGNNGNNNENGYAPNAGPYAPGATAENNNNNSNDDYGYAHGHDVITGIKYIVNYGNTSTVTQTPEYASWTTYVDSVQFAQWLDSFTNAQLDALEQEIRFSLLYINNDPLARAILQKVIDERNSPNRRPPATSAAQTGFASFFSQPSRQVEDDREKDAALEALTNNPSYDTFYTALRWFDEENNGTHRYMRFRKFVQNQLPSIIHTFTDEELTQINNCAYESLTTDQRYDDLVQIISQIEIARANGNYGNGMNENQRNNQYNGNYGNGMNRNQVNGSQKTNNTEGYNNNNNGMNFDSTAQQGWSSRQLGARADELSSRAALASAALGYTGRAPMARPFGQPSLQLVGVHSPQQTMAMGRSADLEDSLTRLTAYPGYRQFYDALKWFDKEDYGSRSFMAFQEYIQTIFRNIITSFTDEQLDKIWNHMLETDVSDDRYDNLAEAIGRERRRRGGARVTTGRVNFNALAAENPARARSGSRNSASTFSSLNSAERRHWELFPNNIENALRPGTLATPMESYSAAKYKSKMAKKSKKKTPQKGSKAKSKKRNGNGGGGGGGGGGSRWSGGGKRHTLKKSNRKRMTKKV